MCRCVGPLNGSDPFSETVAQNAHARVHGVAQEVDRSLDIHVLLRSGRGQPPAKRWVDLRLCSWALEDSNLWPLPRQGTAGMTTAMTLTCGSIECAGQRT